MSLKPIKLYWRSEYEGILCISQNEESGRY